MNRAERRALGARGGKPPTQDRVRAAALAAAEETAAIEFPDVAELVGFVDDIRAAARDQAERYRVVDGYQSVTRLRSAAESLDEAGRRFQEVALHFGAAIDELQGRAGGSPTSCASATHQRSRGDRTGLTGGPAGRRWPQRGFWWRGECRVCRVRRYGPFAATAADVVPTGAAAACAAAVAGGVAAVAAPVTSAGGGASPAAVASPVRRDGGGGDRGDVVGAGVVGVGV